MLSVGSTVFRDYRIFRTWCLTDRGEIQEADCWGHSTSASQLVKMGTNHSALRFCQHGPNCSIFLRSHRGLKFRETMSQISPSSIKLFMLGTCSHNYFLKAGVLQSFTENISQGSTTAKEIVSMKHGKTTVWKCPDGRIPEEELPRC